MKYQCPPRCGFTAQEVTILKSKLFKLRQAGSTAWKDLNDFCEWAKKEGYKQGMRIKRRDIYRPHSQENSYFAFTGEEQERHATYVDAESPFCQSCGVKDCPSKSIGCYRWREYFVKNWNENICNRTKPVIKTEEPIFRYEHPDLVREGIVFEHCTSVP